jgi:hypothetical protein
LSVWDLAQLPNITKISEINAPVGDNFSGTLTAVWPRPNLLVWSGGSQFNGWWGMPIFLNSVATTDAAVGIAAPIGIFPGWRWGGSGGDRLAAFDVSDAANPSLKSVVTVSSNGWSFSKAVVAEGLVYLSHQMTEQILIPIEPPPPGETNTPTATSGWGGDGTNIIRFVTRFFLDVVDYTDAANPVLRKPVNIPGSLQGVSHQGGVIYTTGPHFDAEGRDQGSEFLDASAYDGVAAFLIDSLSLTNWPHPVVVNSPDIFIGRESALERWQLTDEGLLAKLSATDTKEPVYNLRFFGDLAALTTNNRILLYDASNRASFKLAGEAPVSCTYGADLQNADGSLQRGVYIPQSDYGVHFVPITPAPGL